MKNSRDSQRVWRTSISTALTLLLILAGLPAHAGPRTGAKVSVMTRSGARYQGELVAVKPASVLLLDQFGWDQSIDLSDVQTVHIHRKSNAVPGALLGLVIGAGGGYLAGIASARAGGACPDCEAPLSGYAIGIVGGFIGLGAGAVLGRGAGRDLVISFCGLTEAGRTAQIRRLRRYARVAAPL